MAVYVILLFAVVVLLLRKKAWYHSHWLMLWLRVITYLIYLFRHLFYSSTCCRLVIFILSKGFVTYCSVDIRLHVTGVRRSQLKTLGKKKEREAKSNDNKLNEVTQHHQKDWKEQMQGSLCVTINVRRNEFFTAWLLPLLLQPSVYKYKLVYSQ